MIMVLSGWPAAGKSTFASWLADEYGYRHVDVDFNVSKQVDDKTSAAWDNFL